MTIKSNKNTVELLRNHMKLLLGEPIELGRTYAGLTVPGGEERNEVFTPVLFEEGTLLLASADRRQFLFVRGDMAAFGDRLILQNPGTGIHFDDPVTPETDFTGRFHKIPRGYLDMILRGVQGMN